MLGIALFLALFPFIMAYLVAETCESELAGLFSFAICAGVSFTLFDLVWRAYHAVSTISGDWINHL